MITTTEAVGGFPLKRRQGGSSANGGGSSIYVSGDVQKASELVLRFVGHDSGGGIMGDVSCLFVVDAVSRRRRVISTSLSGPAHGPPGSWTMSWRGATGYLHRYGCCLMLGAGAQRFA
jgi:hypothetical protein